MDFLPTEAQTDLAALTRTILDGVSPDTTGEPLDRPLWTELAKAGVLSATLPVAAGGDGLGLLEQCSVLVELGRSLAPVPYLESIVVGATAVAQFGSPDQVARFASPAARGELILTVALGDDPVHASPAGDGFVLTGTRGAVPAATIADVILVPATVDASDATAVILVETAADGLTLSPQRISGSLGAAQLDLENVRVSADAVLGPTNRSAVSDDSPVTDRAATDARPVGDADVAAWLRGRASIAACAAQLGILERALELTAAHARTRHQFGRPIGEFQAVAGRLADAYIDVEALRLTLWQAAWRLAADLPATIEVATAKFWAADAGHRVAHTTVHVHGGVGIDIAHTVHRYYLAAVYHEFWLGPATTQLLVLGDALANTP